MEGKRIAVKILLALLAAAAMGFVAPSWTGAQIILLEQGVGPESEQTMSPAEGMIVIPSDDSAMGETDRGFELPMHAPDTQMGGRHVPPAAVDTGSEGRRASARIR